MVSFSVIGVFSLYPTTVNGGGPTIPDSPKPPVHEHNSSVEFFNRILHVENITITQ